MPFCPGISAPLALTLITSGITDFETHSHRCINSYSFGFVKFMLTMLWPSGEYARHGFKSCLYHLQFGNLGKLHYHWVLAAHLQNRNTNLTLLWVANKVKYFKLLNIYNELNLNGKLFFIIKTIKQWRDRGHNVWGSWDIFFLIRLVNNYKGYFSNLGVPGQLKTA